MGMLLDLIAPLWYAVTATHLAHMLAVYACVETAFLPECQQSVHVRALSPGCLKIDLFGLKRQ